MENLSDINEMTSPLQKLEIGGPVFRIPYAMMIFMKLQILVSRELDGKSYNDHFFLAPTTSNSPGAMYHQPSRFFVLISTNQQPRLHLFLFHRLHTHAPMSPPALHSNLTLLICLSNQVWDERIIFLLAMSKSEPDIYNNM